MSIDKIRVTPKKEFIEINNLPSEHIEFIDSIIEPAVFFTQQLPYVAGGFLRRWVQGEKLSEMTCDVDIYNKGSGFDPTNKDKFFEYAKTILLGEPIKPSSQFQSCHTKTAINGKEWLLQIMHEAYNVALNNHGPHTHLLTFDTTASMILYDYSGGKFYHHEDFLNHAQNKIHEFNSQCRGVSPVRQLSRYSKFIKEGYSTTAESDRRFLNWVIVNSNKLYSTDNYEQ